MTTPTHATLALTIVLASACPSPPSPLDVNHPPIARVVVPQLWPVSQPATIDGSFSEDEDGDSLHFLVDWGDGTPAAGDDDGIAQHVYATPGTFALELTVEDAEGIPSRVQTALVIVGDDDSACTCDLGCFEDAVCTERGCLLFASAVEDEEPPEDVFFDAFDCEF